MRIGQTSIIVFLSKLLGSVLGFLATIYFARELGAEVLGVYALVITAVGWLILFSEAGIGGAAIKRISEGREQGAFFSATILWVVSISLTLSIVVFLLRSFFEQYVSEFSQYISISVVWFIILLLFATLFNRLLNQILKGQRMVHIVGLLNPVQIGMKSLLQIVLVVAGFGLLGMFAGYVLGGILIGLVALYWVEIRPRVPRKRHFQGLFDYAKYSWLGALKSRTFNEVDILLLGVFVQSSLVGVYSVSWSIAKFIELFGNSISQTMFPEISYTSSQESKNDVRGLIEDALSFSGLVAIPGLIGGAILADRLLRIYGQEFVQGASALALLILATLLYSYVQQLLNALNGIDRPDLAFRINTVFIVLNAGLNVLLIPQFGINGAAVASVTSVAVVFVLAHRILERLIEFDVPVREISRQVAAAVIMGVVVFSGVETIESLGVLQHNFIIVLLTVGMGAGVYFVTLLGISPQFRQTVGRNLPFELPYFA